MSITKITVPADLTINGERFIILAGTCIEPWVAADEVFKMDRFNAVKFVASGEVKNIAKVVAFNLKAGTCRDATAEIAADVMDRWAIDDDELSDWQLEFVELHMSMQAARSFRRAA